MGGKFATPYSSFGQEIWLKFSFITFLGKGSKSTTGEQTYLF